MLFKITDITNVLNGSEDHFFYGFENELMNINDKINIIAGNNFKLMKILK